MGGPSGFLTHFFPLLFLFSLRCSCKEQPALSARPLTKPDLDSAAPGSPGSPGAFSFLLRPPGRSALSRHTALLLRPPPPDGPPPPRTAKGAQINHPTCSSSVFIHPSGSRFSFKPFFPLFLFWTTSTLHSSFRRNNGVVLSCTFCGTICSYAHQRITRCSSLGPFTPPTAPPPPPHSNHWQTASAADFWTSAETE